MKDQVVRYHTAVKAKEKGFWWECFHFVAHQDDGTINVNYGFNHPLRTKDSLNVPTQALLCKWARDEYNKNIYPVKKKYGWVCIIIDCDDENDFTYSRNYDEYEEAMEEGLNIFLESLETSY